MSRKRISGEYKRTLEELHGCRCVNCGTTEDIEWHHVVPLSLGGSDTPENMYPVCYRCHKAVTAGTPLPAIWMRKKKSGGRPFKIPDNYKEILDMYLRCVIGKAKCKELLNLSEKNKMTDTPWFADYKKERGIHKYRNNIDLLRVKGKLATGVIAGFITYTDGTTQVCYYNEDADNAIQKEPTAQEKTSKLIETQAQQLKKQEFQINELEERLKAERDRTEALAKLLEECNELLRREPVR